MSEPLTPDLPPIAELTIRKAHQLMCADYLRMVAKLIEQGTLESFELTWNLNYRKPVGRLVTSADFLTGAVEGQFVRNVAAYEAEQAKKIQAIDISDDPDILAHKPCVGAAREHCALCNDKLS